MNTPGPATSRLPGSGMLVQKLHRSIDIAQLNNLLTASSTGTITYDTIPTPSASAIFTVTDNDWLTGSLMARVNSDRVFFGLGRILKDPRLADLARGGGDDDALAEHERERIVTALHRGAVVARITVRMARLVPLQSGAHGEEVP